MKFKLTTSGTFYPQKKDRDALEKLGFKFKYSEHFKKFQIDNETTPYIEFDTLDQLVDFITQLELRKYRSELIISIFNGEPHIEIYDDYR